MIILDRVTKSFPMKRGRKYVLRDASLQIARGGRLGLLGRNGAGKSTLLKIISGATSPDKGRVLRRGRLSWPLGFAGGFHHALSGAQNVRFVARIYGKDSRDLLRYVEDFAELGADMHMPVGNYSSGMRARLAFGVSLGIAFDYYLIDEVTAVGDRNFAQKARTALNKRLENAGVIMVSHSAPALRQFCDSGVVLEKGELSYFEDLEDAIEYHNSIN